MRELERTGLVWIVRGDFNVDAITFREWLAEVGLGPKDAIQGTPRQFVRNGATRPPSHRDSPTLRSL